MYVPDFPQWLMPHSVNSHELVVPANALWDVGFSDTNCLWTSETDKIYQKKAKIKWEYNKKHDIRKATSEAIIGEEP